MSFAYSFKLCFSWFSEAALCLPSLALAVPSAMQAAAAAGTSVLFLLYVIGLQGLFQLYALYIAPSRE